MSTTSAAVARHAQLLAAGYNADVAEALAENDIGVAHASALSPDYIFDLYLKWNGIIGYSTSIANALDNIRYVGKL
jgi:hypothetical protein